MSVLKVKDVALLFLTNLLHNPMTCEHTHLLFYALTEIHFKASLYLWHVNTRFHTGATHFLKDAFLRIPSAIIMGSGK